MKILNYIPSNIASQSSGTTEANICYQKIFCSIISFLFLFFTWASSRGAFTHKKKGSLVTSAKVHHTPFPPWPNNNKINSDEKFEVWSPSLLSEIVTALLDLSLFLFDRCHSWIPYVVHLNIGTAYIYFIHLGTSVRRSSRSAFGRLTGNGVSGH